MDEAPVGRRLVVDALNVIGSRPTGWWRDRAGAVRALAERLHAEAAATGRPITLVVDGHPLDGLPEGTRDGLEVLYAHSRARDAADRRIVTLVGERDEPVTVVTADRDLRDRVAALGAELSGPRQLLERLDQRSIG